MATDKIHHGNNSKKVTWTKCGAESSDKDSTKVDKITCRLCIISLIKTSGRSRAWKDRLIELNGYYR